MNEILISILLTVPLFDSHDSWSINQVPAQVQVHHRDSCITVSYSAKSVHCDNTTPAPNQRLMVEDSDWLPVCYLVLDIGLPEFIKSCNYQRIKHMVSRKDYIDSLKGGEHK
jgi:hypothetical protein